ncbi:hypothetical protein M885DRAFT_611679 [Pelagophyceae sp. CCMP2097]|nr:hypothetical protein M885DRAFT_611679 [Pelagophyceae sp. CCMP2097]
MLRSVVLVSLYASAAGLAPKRAARSLVVRHGFLEDLMDKLEGKSDPKAAAWKEQMFQEQQVILKRRREPDAATGGFIDEKMEEEIKERRAGFMDEKKVLTDIQKQKGDEDITDQWKKARDAGKFKTASSGLKRDESSSRLGAAGLFAERTDERLPYIDRGYVAKKDGKKDSKEEKAPPPSPQDFLKGLDKFNPFAKK